MSIGILKSIRPLLLFGSSLAERISNIDILKQYAKKINPSFVFFNVFLWSNSASINYTGIKSLTSSDIKKADSLIFADLTNIYYTQKYLLKNFENKVIFNFKSFVSLLNFSNGYEIKTKNFFEKSETFLNLEFRAQKTQKILKEGKSFCMYSLLNYVFNLNTIESKENAFLNHNSFIDEILSNSISFSFFLKKKYSNAFHLDNFIDKTKISNYVLKPQGQCFYTLNYFSKYSIFMLKASKKYQEISNNFYQ
jgi:hypothetical protein